MAYTTYPGVDENNSFPQPVRQAIANSSEVVSKINSATTSTLASANQYTDSNKTALLTDINKRVPYRETNGEDLNLCLITEDVMFRSMSSTSNAPDTLLGFLQVRATSNGMVLQRWTTYFRSSSQPVWTRFLNSSNKTWSAWALSTYRGPNPATFADDFDTYRTPGVYAINGTTHPNIPVARTGSLIVNPSSGLVSQTYITHEVEPVVYIRRASSNTAWNPWIRLPNNTQVAKMVDDALASAKKYVDDELNELDLDIDLSKYATNSTVAQGDAEVLSNANGYSDQKDIEILDRAKNFASSLAFGDTGEATDALVSTMIRDLTKQTAQELARAYSRVDDPKNLFVVTNAVGDGSTNDSAHFIAAVNAVSASGGGVITGLKGKTYRVQGIPLKENVWFDFRGIKLLLPTNATQPMFKSDVTPRFTGGGIIGGEFSGVNNQQNFVDFTGVTTLEHFVIDSVFARLFKRGISGSQNDRFLVLTNSRIHHNNIGVYVNMNHPILHFNDIRYNDIGLTGNINDLFAIGNKFNNNRIGVTPDPEVNGRIMNSQFISGAVGKNTSKGMILDHSNSVVGILFYGNDSNDTGLTLRGEGNMVTANLFGYMAQIGNWGDACIRFDGQNDSRFNLDSNIIVGNRFMLNSPTGDGIVDSSTSTASIRAAIIQGNSVKVFRNRKFINFANSPVGVSKVTDNTIVVRSDSTHTADPTDALIYMADVGLTGVDITDNVFSSDRQSNPAKAIWTNTLSGSLIAQNRFRNYVEPVGSANWANSSVINNPGLKTYAEGLATIPASATKVTVNHGLVHPNASDIAKIALNSTNSMGSANKCWISGVTATSFDINVDVAPGASLATFRWAIDAGR